MIVRKRAPNRYSPPSESWSPTYRHQRKIRVSELVLRPSTHKCDTQIYPKRRQSKGKHNGAPAKTYGEYKEISQSASLRQEGKMRGSAGKE